MNGAGILANRIDAQKANKTTSEFIIFVKAYIQEYHTDIAEKVDFYVDNLFSSSVSNIGEYEEVLEKLEKELGVEKDLKSDLEDMEKRRNASENSIKYATLHAFVQDGDVNSQVAQMSNFLKKTQKIQVI